MKRSLKVVLLVEGINVPEWQYILLQRLLLARQIRIVWVITTVQVKLMDNSAQGIGLKILSGIDRFWYKQAGSAHQLRSLSSLQAKHNFRTLGDQALQQDFHQEGIDILINLQNHTDVPPWAYPLVRLGVWEVFFDVDLSAYHRWSGLRAVSTGEEKIWCGVRHFVHPQEPCSCLFLSSSSTDYLSLNRSTEPMLWKMAATVPFLISELQKSDNPFQYLKNKQQQYNNQFRTLQKKAGVLPVSGGGRLLNLISKCTKGKLQSLFNKLFVCKRWILLHGKQLHLPELKYLSPPKGYFWADPCLIKHQNRYFIFIEEWVYTQKKGRISVLEWYQNGLFSSPRVILDLPYHLSYPFVFEYQGDFYLVPESAENRTIDIYRCSRFPDRWEHVKTLMSDVEAYDATLQYHAGYWWMFVNIKGHTLSSPDDLLHLFYADSPLSENWISHPANPIVADVATARPAGRIFAIGDQLYRPSQNCAGSYGRGLNMNLIVEWNKQYYKERTVRRQIPNGEANLTGMHTFSAIDNRILSDGIYQRLCWQKEQPTHD